MKRTYLTVIVALAVLLGTYGVGWATTASGDPNNSHGGYRAGGYVSGCGGTNTGACHTYASTPKFLPTSLGLDITKDYTNFCLSCHNATGEAHDRNVGEASTNAYINNTGALISGSYKGDSHSWKGVNRGAGTKTPAAGTMSTHEPGGKVLCQTCHQGMSKNSETNVPAFSSSVIREVADTDTSVDNINYHITGYSNTKQYLGHYIMVYRDNNAWSTVQKKKIRKQYLVDPSEYTYDYSTATVTFKTAQSPTAYIFVEIPQPYFRTTNAQNAMCVDCHDDRVSTQASHAPGTGAVSHHPNRIAFGHGAGLNDTIKPAASSEVFLEYTAGVGNRVLCTACHDPHRSASKDGDLLRNADGSTLCADCHKTILDGYSTTAQGAVNKHNGSKHSTATVCLDCHTTHGSNNIMLIRNTINGKTINFQNFSGANSFGNDTGSSLCEACHSATTFHLSSNAPAGQGHNTGLNCLDCHKHASGFKGGGCTTCHGQPPATGDPFPTGWNDTTGDKHLAHQGYIGLTGAALCAKCHGAKNGSGTHPESLNTAFIDTALWGGGTFSDGGTIGKTNTADDTCTNVNCHSTTGTRVWGGPRTCGSCHEFPTTGNEWSGNNGHLVRFDGVVNRHLPATGYNTAANDDATMASNYSSVVTDNLKCGLCHYGTKANHRNSAVNMQANGKAACSGTDFTINVTTSGSNVTCTNVVCHSSKTTPNWW